MTNTDVIKKIEYRRQLKNRIKFFDIARTFFVMIALISLIMFLCIGFYCCANDIKTLPLIGKYCGYIFMGCVFLFLMSVGQNSDTYYLHD